jgi:branched-chain amino acid transport system substrate-binding protein
LEEKKMKKRVLMSMLLILGVLLSACNTGSSTIKIAVLAPLSGSNPTFGASTRDGALLAIKQWNAKGGVLGKQIEVVIADSQCSADPGRNAANKVIDQDKVHYIIGEVCSSASIPISEIAEAKHVV